MLPPLTSIHRIQLHTLDSIGAQKKNSLRPISVVTKSPDKIVYTEQQIEELYEIAGKFMNGSISMEESILKFRAGGIEDWVAALGIIAAIITVLYNQNVDGFQVPPGAIPPPHLAWLYGNQRPHHQFGYGKNAGPKSFMVTGTTQNAGSEKKQPSDGSWNYIDVMNKLKKQSNKKMVGIQIADQTYIIRNRYSLNANELGDKLAEKVYDSIRECDTDICDIAANLGFKADNIKNVKDHLFYNEHELDQYAAQGEKSEYKRFDPNLQQALAWKRLEAGIHTADDIEWIKHECAERHHE